MDSAVTIDLNAILIPLSWLFGTLALVFGVALVIRSFFRFRAQVSQSIQMDLEVIKVMKKPTDPNESAKNEAWMPGFMGG